jgi:hypothetical protein
MKSLGQLSHGPPPVVPPVLLALTSPVLPLVPGPVVSLVPVVPVPDIPVVGCSAVVPPPLLPSPLEEMLPVTRPLVPEVVSPALAPPPSSAQPDSSTAAPAHAPTHRSKFMRDTIHASSPPVNGARSLRSARSASQLRDHS